MAAVDMRAMAGTKLVVVVVFAFASFCAVSFKVALAWVELRAFLVKSGLFQSSHYYRRSVCLLKGS